MGDGGGGEVRNQRAHLRAASFLTFNLRRATNSTLSSIFRRTSPSRRISDGGGGKLRQIGQSPTLSSAGNGKSIRVLPESSSHASTGRWSQKPFGIEISGRPENRQRSAAVSPARACFGHKSDWTTIHLNYLKDHPTILVLSLARILYYKCNMKLTARSRSWFHMR